MKNTFGNNISVTLFGESHGKEIGAILDGIPAGIKLDLDFISSQLNKRKAIDDISTSRKEEDTFQILSGVNNEVTLGTPICIVIPNKDISKNDYNLSLIRPSHSDLSLFLKHGKSGLTSGGGHSSGRLTAPLVAAGAVAIQILESKGVYIGTHIKRIKNISDRDFCDIAKDIKELNNSSFAVLENDSKEKMIKEISEAKSNNDSVGGVLETVVLGLEGGVGEPFFDSVESLLSHALFSIPAVKGVEFGNGFYSTYLFGSENNDMMYFENDEIKFKTNNQGGVQGGISNGAPLVFRTAIKPTPTISKEQTTINIDKKTNEKVCFTGRHDPCIVHRARVVVDSITAIALLDMLFSKYGLEGIK